MDSRERVALALDHQQPDRVPIDYWATSSVTARLLEHFGLSTQEELLQHLGVDFRYIDGPKYVGPEPEVHEDGSVEDHWGVPRVRVEIGSGAQASVYREVLHFPLQQAQSVAEIRDYAKWPSPDWFDYACVARQVAEAQRTGKVVVFMGDRMNRCAQLKPAMYLRGVDQILLDLALRPEVAEYIFRRIAEFYLEYVRRTLEAGGGGIDVLMMGDDFGTQRGLFMSPAMWRRFLRPGFQAFIDLGRAYGCKVAHHSCGSIKPIIPDLIECGLDILNVIGAITAEVQIVLAEQYRPPVKARGLDLPMGLSGDLDGAEGEDLQEAARRELLEETGYAAARLEWLGEGPASAGLTNEVLIFFLARDCRSAGKGGGDATEDIQVHVVALDQADAWLERKRAGGVLLDPKIFAAMYFARQHVPSGE
jgi:uroporphyrinogen decarboxylase